MTSALYWDMAPNEEHQGSRPQHWPVYCPRLTTQSDASPLVQPCQSEVQYFATDVVKEDIKVSNRFFELVLERWTLIVQGCVYLELFFEPAALFI